MSPRVPEVLLCLSKSLVVIRDYALTACAAGPPRSEALLTRSASPDPFLAREGSGDAACPGEGSAEPKQPGGPDLVRGPEPPYTIRTPQRGGNRHPAWGVVVRSRHVSTGAGTRAAAKLPREDSPTYRIQYGRHKCALTQQSPRRLLPGCTIDRALPRHTVSRWRHPRHACQSATPVGHDGSPSPIMTPTR